MVGRKDPYGNFRFRVEIDGIEVAGFSEASGLQAEIEVEEVREGGVNGYVHRLPKIIKYPNLVLKRGLTDSSFLWDWYCNYLEDMTIKKSIFIVLLDIEGNDKWRWSFSDAYPVKWVGPDLKADSNTVAIESLEIVHNGIKGEIKG